MSRYTYSTGLKACLLVFLFSFLLQGVSIADTDSAELLTQMLGDVISVRVQSTGAVVEFCPDNTCEVFQSLGKQNKSPVAHFAYLYLYYVSDYAVLSEVRKSPEAKRAAERLLSQIGKHACASSSQIETIKCVLRHLAKQHSISLTFVRYDEQVRSAGPMDLEPELSRLKPLDK